MQIVIDIPEKVKKKRDAGKVLSGEEITTVCMAIKNGTPLPKGHGRLIDADAEDLQSELWTFVRYTGIDEAPYENACLALDKAPTIVEADGGAE